MQPDSQELNTNAVIAEAQALLARRFGGSPELSLPSELHGDGDALVLRVKVSPQPFLEDRSLIIKKMPEDKALSNKGGDPAFLRELVSYQYTNTLSPKVRPGPFLLSYDIENRLIILSDVGDGENFIDILNFGSQEKRCACLRKLGRILGKMHVATTHGEDSFRTLSRRLLSKHHLDPNLLLTRDSAGTEAIREGMYLVSELGIDVHPIVELFAEEAIRRQIVPPFVAFTPFDLSPENILVTERITILDFEWAGFRDVTFDVASVIAGFPQENSTASLNDEEVDEFLAAWKAEVSDAWPLVRDLKQCTTAIMSALIGWALMSVSFYYHGRLSSEDEGYRRRHGKKIEMSHLSSHQREQLRDIATTMEAIHRFARRHDTEGFFEVELFASGIMDYLHSYGIHPHQREN